MIPLAMPRPSKFHLVCCCHTAHSSSYQCGLCVSGLHGSCPARIWVGQEKKKAGFRAGKENATPNRKKKNQVEEAAQQGSFLMNPHIGDQIRERRMQLLSEGASVSQTFDMDVEPSALLSESFDESSFSTNLGFSTLNLSDIGSPAISSTPMVSSIASSSSSDMVSGMTSASAVVKSKKSSKPASKKAQSTSLPIDIQKQKKMKKTPKKLAKTMVKAIGQMGVSLKNAVPLPAKEVVVDGHNSQPSIVSTRDVSSPSPHLINDGIVRSKMQSATHSAPEKKADVNDDDIEIIDVVPAPVYNMAGGILPMACHDEYGVVLFGDEGHQDVKPFVSPAIDDFPDDNLPVIPGSQPNRHQVSAPIPIPGADTQRASTDNSDIIGSLQIDYNIDFSSLATQGSQGEEGLPSDLVDTDIASAPLSQDDSLEDFIQYLNSMQQEDIPAAKEAEDAQKQVQTQMAGDQHQQLVAGAASVFVSDPMQQSIWNPNPADAIFPPPSVQAAAAAEAAPPVNPLIVNAGDAQPAMAVGYTTPQPQPPPPPQPQPPPPPQHKKQPMKQQVLNAEWPSEASFYMMPSTDGSSTQLPSGVSSQVGASSSVRTFPKKSSVTPLKTRNKNEEADTDIDQRMNQRGNARRRKLYAKVIRSASPKLKTPQPERKSTDIPVINDDDDDDDDDIMLWPAMLSHAEFVELAMKF